MIKKIILILIIIGLIFMCVKYYNSQKTIECWWGVLYPSLTNVGFEDDTELDSKISSSNPDYIPTNFEKKPIKIKIAIFEWFKNLF